MKTQKPYLNSNTDQSTVSDKTCSSNSTSTSSLSFIWFGAGVSIAEIITGTYFAPLGFAKGLIAIVTGHLIGAVLFFLTGFIGAKTKKSSMQTVGLSFGKNGILFFASLNILQLVLWTSIMIYDGAVSLNGIFACGKWLWCFVTGGLIFVWIVLRFKNVSFVNRIAAGLLFVLSVVLCIVIFINARESGFCLFNNVGSLPDSELHIDGDVLSFGAAVELGVAMPLSWLPLVSDYTRDAERPLAGSAGCTLTYFFVSVWMYAVGMSAAIFTSESDIALIMVKAGLGITALFIIVLSTVTTTFLDAWSTGVSSEVFSKKLNAKTVSLITVVLGTFLAFIFNMDDITDFLYFIGSVFTPMAAVMIADFYFTKSSSEEKKIDWVAAVLWCVGFILYRFLMKVDLLTGCTSVCMIITVILTITVRVIEKRVIKK